MALKKCPECGNEISKKAQQCPKCGAPGKRRTSRFTWLVTILVVVGFIGVFSADDQPTRSSSDAPESPEPVQDSAAETESSECQAGDLQCNGDKYIYDAESACAPKIEALAKYDYEWTDGWLGSKFSRFAWVEGRDRRVMRYFGDTLKLQNGFGAWQPHQYYCDFDLTSGAALSVFAEPGRLQ